ncbi:MAG: signal peptidase I [Candidatus Omnitrophota bacterium]|jgi:signal peptidase I|nr:MAG: signal peptidase I [Candidatus Omnitrophota bacterium]
MRRFYLLLASKLKYFSWGRAIVNHISRHYRLYENLEALYTALILALLIKTFIFEAYKIPSKSMCDTLKEGDRIFVNKFLYDLRPIHVGDVVVFKTKGIPPIESPDKPYYIKRVVGLPGDRLEIMDDGHLRRNGKILESPDFFNENFYTVLYNRKRNFVVPEGCLYVFGDNSMNSSDSREWGAVPIDNVMGKAFFRYWPLSRFGLIKGVPTEKAQEYVKRERPLPRESGFGNQAQAAER